MDSVRFFTTLLSLSLVSSSVYVSVVTEQFNSKNNIAIKTIATCRVSFKNLSGAGHIVSRHILHSKQFTRISQALCTSTLSTVVR